MFVNSIAIFLFTLTLSIRAQPTTRCDGITQKPYSFTVMQQQSPWEVLLSSDSTYSCTTGILTGPAPVNGVTYTWVMIQNDTVKNVAAITDEGNIAVKFTTCNQGVEYEYKFLVFTANYFITYICEPSGGSVFLLRAYGHTPADLEAAKLELAKYNFTYSNGTTTVVDTYTGCKKAPYCTGFYL